ncbi:hypothetical protein Golax_025662, partial [Gossypium laxum]|nr:hypothetical protein [Gossypium laxum]
VYGLVIFPKALGHVDEAVTDLFDRLDKKVTPIPTILAETFRSLNECRRTGEGRFIGCAQLLLAWFHSHFWKVDKNLREEDIEWRAPWMLPDEILYRCGNFDWIPLLGIWGAVGYAPLLVLRQYRSRQFTRRMKRLAVGPIVTPEYIEWWGRRINDNISGPSQGDKLEKKIEQIEEENMNLRLDIDVQKLEIEKLRKGKNKAEEDLDTLKTDYKRFRCWMKAAGLGKTSEQWNQEIQGEKIKADR